VVEPPRQLRGRPDPATTPESDSLTTLRPSLLSGSLLESVTTDTASSRPLVDDVRRPAPTRDDSDDADGDTDPAETVWTLATAQP